MLIHLPQGRDGLQSLMNLRKLISAGLAIAAAVCASGCATVFSKSNYDVTIRTNVPQATATIIRPKTGAVVAVGKTPLRVRLKASESFFHGAIYHCEVKTPDDQKKKLVIYATADPWIMGNVIIGGVSCGLICCTIDALTGAIFKLDDSYSVHFDAAEALP